MTYQFHAPVSEAAPFASLPQGQATECVETAFGKHSWVELAIPLLVMFGIGFGVVSL